MEGQQHRLFRGVVALVGATVMLTPGIAAGQTTGASDRDRRNPDGVTVSTDDQTAFVVEGEKVAKTSDTKGPRVRRSPCAWTRLSEYEITHNADPGLRDSDARSTIAADRPAPNAIAYNVRCGTESRIRWVIPTPAPQSAAAAPTTARGVALAFRDEVPMPNVTIQMTPSSWGICNMESWFWVTGWNGSPITWSRTTPWGTQVELEATPVSYRWDFGDGTVVDTTSLGRPYPVEAGAVKHAYQVKNLTGYPVTVHFVFRARWREGGGPWNEDVAGIERTATVSYPVHEIRTYVVERG